MIRAVRPTDVAALRAFLGRAGAAELTTHTWPKVEPESGHLPLLGILGQVLSPNSSRGGMWVAMVGGRLAGYAVARARCDGMVWDVEHLHAADSGAAVELLDHVCGKAVDAGGRRVFFEVPAKSEALAPARRAGFERYASSSLLRLTRGGPMRGISAADYDRYAATSRGMFGMPSFRRPGTPSSTAERTNIFAARPRLRADDHLLFQLYNAAVPAKVRAAEAMTYEEWSALHRGSKKWAPSLLGDRHQFVWDIGSGLMGWLEVVYGQKSQFLEFLIHPQHENMLDRMIAYALTHVSEKAPVYTAARDYQPALVTSLQRASFGPAGDVEILVRQLAARVPEPKLVPAKLVGG